jgi:hypothetical protein
LFTWDRCKLSGCNAALANRRYTYVVNVVVVVVVVIVVVVVALQQRLNDFLAQMEYVPDSWICLT